MKWKIITALSVATAIFITLGIMGSIKEGREESTQQPLEPGEIRQVTVTMTERYLSREWLEPPVMRNPSCEGLNGYIRGEPGLVYEFRDKYNPSLTMTNRAEDSIKVTIPITAMQIRIKEGTPTLPVRYIYKSY